MSPLAWAHHILARLERMALYVASAAALAIMGVASADVGCRYVLGAPLGWAYELIANYLTVTLFFFGLAASFSGDHQVRVDVFVRLAPSGAQKALSFLSSILVALLALMMLATAAQTAWTDWSEAAVTSGEIHWPTWIPPAIVATGSSLLLLRMLLDAATHLVGAPANNSTDVPEANEVLQKY